MRAALLAALALVACDSERRASSADTPVATPATANAAGPCADALQVTLVETDAGAGQRNVTLALTNAGSTACDVAGRPNVEARTGGAATEGAHMGGIKVTYSPEPAVTLTPGARATFDVSYTGIAATDRPCVDADSIRVTPPTASRATTLPLAMHLCAERTLRVSAVRPAAP